MPSFVLLVIGWPMRAVECEVTSAHGQVGVSVVIPWVPYQLRQAQAMVTCAANLTITLGALRADPANYFRGVGQRETVGSWLMPLELVSAASLR